MPDSFLIRTHLDFHARVSQKQLTCFVPSGLNMKLRNCLEKNLQALGFLWCSRIAMDQKCQRVLVVLTHLDIQSHISSIDKFLVEADYSYPITIKFRFLRKYRVDLFHQVLKLKLYNCAGGFGKKKSSILIPASEHH